MICHGAVSRCMTSDSANGSNCGVCSDGTLSAALTEAICEFREDPQIARKPAVESCPAPRGPAEPRRSAADPRSRPADRPGPARAAGRRRHGRGDPDDRLRRGELEFADRGFKIGGRFRFRASAPAPLRIRAPARARRRGSAIARPAAAMRGGSGPAAAESCLRPETAPADGTAAAPDRRCAAAPSSSVPRTTLRNCSSTKLATAVSSPRSMARSNSRISSACDCGGSCAR